MKTTKNHLKLREIALIACAIIALIGSYIVNDVRADVADAAITCMQEAHDLSACSDVARHSGMGFWDVLAIFAALGWAAGALSYVAGQSAAEERARRAGVTE